MTDTQHTPGPWHIEPDALGEFSISSADGATIADAYGRNPANTRLIVAAPETVDALRDLLWAVTGFGDFEAQYPEEVAAARATIAKATGQEG